MMWNGFGFHEGWSGMGLGMVVFWLLLVVVLVVVLRSLAADKNRRTPLEVLDERYARGEIDRKEYEQKRTDLTR